MELRVVIVNKDRRSGTHIRYMKMARLEKCRLQMKLAVIAGLAATVRSVSTSGI